MLFLQYKPRLSYGCESCTDVAFCAAINANCVSPQIHCQVQVAESNQLQQICIVAVNNEHSVQLVIYFSKHVRFFLCFVPDMTCTALHSCGLANAMACICVWLIDRLSCLAEANTDLARSLLAAMFDW